MREQAVAWVGSTAAKPGSERGRKSPGQPSKTALAALPPLGRGWFLQRTCGDRLVHEPTLISALYKLKRIPPQRI